LRNHEKIRNECEVGAVGWGTIMLDFEEAWRSTDMAIIVVSTRLDGFYYGVVFCSRLEQYKKINHQSHQ
jgi:hypothetical protein